MLGKHSGVTHSSGLPGTRAFPGVQDIQYQDLGSPRQTGTTSHPHSINLRPTCSKCRFQNHKFCTQSSFKPYWCPVKSEDTAQEGCLRNAGPCRPSQGAWRGPNVSSRTPGHQDSSCPLDSATLSVVRMMVTVMMQTAPQATRCQYYLPSLQIIEQRLRDDG